MSSALKELLEKNRKRKANIKDESVSEKGEPTALPLPKNKSLNKNENEVDQCFIVIPDIHSYEKDEKAFELCMESLPIIAKTYNVTKFIQLGDLLEGGSVKSHPTNNVFDVVPPYEDELDWAINDFWKPAMKVFPNANFYALFGNHEDRINKWLANRLGASSVSQAAFNELSPKALYEDMGIHVTPYGNEDSKAGILEIFPRLVCVHGWSFAMNAAKTHLDKMMGANSVIFGHTHRKQDYVRRNPVNDDQVGGWSFGALAKTNLLYNRGIPTDHTLGFGIVLTHHDSFLIIPIDIKATSKGKRKLILPAGQVLEK